MAEVRSVCCWLAGSHAAVPLPMPCFGKLLTMVSLPLAGSGPRGGGQRNHDGCGAFCAWRAAAPACPRCAPSSEQCGTLLPDFITLNCMQVCGV